MHINWALIEGVDHLMVGCDDGSVMMWKLFDDEDGYQARLRWGSMNQGLTVTDATIQDVRGLSKLNEQLLKQRGAVGEPVHRRREASKKLTSMASAISKLQSPIHNAEEKPPAAASVVIGEEAMMEQEDDS
ncbi:hypothetical protein BGX31_003874 [Mortierella sp. GBA43]|nr:hypothetical protein BGX31_003874 [Mortierella sp. GBA43]